MRNFLHLSLLVVSMAAVGTSTNLNDVNHHEASDTQGKKPEFLRPEKMPKKVVKPAGNMASLRCKATGYPTPNITWYKNNETPKRELGDIRYNTWSLVLEDLTITDSGNYTCVVCNTHGCINFTFDVDVVENAWHRPLITEPPINATVAFGESTNLTCNAVSDLYSYIFWTKGFNEANAKEIVQSNTLEISNATYEDEGWYTCVAANALGHSNSSAYLTVI